MIDLRGLSKSERLSPYVLNTLAVKLSIPSKFLNTT